MRLGDGVEAGEHGGLGLKRLRDRLDDVVDVGQRVEIRPGGESPQCRVAVGHGQFAFLDELGEALLDGASRAVDRRGHRVAQPHFEARLREHLGDAIAHGACPDDADTFDVHRSLSSA